MADIAPPTISKYLSEKEISQQVSTSLIDHVYMQLTTGLIASLFCAGIIFIGLFSSSQDNSLLYAWFCFFLLVTLFRYLLRIIYKRQKQVHFVLWKNMYLFGTFLGGMSWGLIGILFFYHASTIHQTLMILMLAGVTAGAVPLSSGVPSAAILFLIFSILPFIATIALLKNTTYLIFDLALSLYFVYAIILSIKTYQLIKKSILLQFEKNSLLKKLMDAKEQLEQINKNLEVTATHDPLTKVANRSLFMINLEEAVRRSCRNSKMLALFYLDLDKFKLINDQYGHNVGDYVLLIVVKRLKNFFGTNDMIARLGGDEFTVIIENVNNVNEIISTAKMICESLKSPIHINHKDLQVGVSIGISLYPDDGTDAETLIQRADKKMYFVKMQGGNSYSDVLL